MPDYYNGKANIGVLSVSSWMGNWSALKEFGSKKHMRKEPWHCAIIGLITGLLLAGAGQFFQKYFFKTFRFLVFLCPLPLNFSPVDGT